MGSESKSLDKLVFNWKNMSEAEAVVGKFIKASSFEKALEFFYPGGIMDHKDELVLIIAINANMSNTRKDYFKKHFGIDLKSYENHELKNFKEEDVVSANRKIGKRNEPFYKAWELVASYRTKNDFPHKGLYSILF